jgi:hypothetical protein
VGGNNHWRAARRQLHCLQSRPTLACLRQRDGASSQSGELAAKPAGGRSDTLGVGARPDGAEGRKRCWLSFHDHTWYLRGSQP